MSRSYEVYGVAWTRVGEPYRLTTMCAALWRVFRHLSRSRVASGVTLSARPVARFHTRLTPQTHMKHITASKQCSTAHQYE